MNAAQRNSTLKEIWLSTKGNIERLYSTSLFLNILPLTECSRDWNKRKSLGANSGKSGECRRSSDFNDLCFSKFTAEGSAIQKILAIKIKVNH